MGVRQLSAAATGVYFWLLCILHESETRGRFCLSKYASKIQANAQAKPEAKGQAKTKQDLEICLKFASVLSKLMPFSAEEISGALDELLYFDIVQINGETLEQKRMVRDAEISLKRASAGKKGGSSRKAAGAEANILLEQNHKQNGSKTTSKTEAKPQAKDEANSGNLLASRAPANPSSREVINNTSGVIQEREEEKGVQGEKGKTDAQIEADKITLFVTLWHQHCPSLPKVQKLTQARRDKIRARLTDEPDLDVWEEVFLKIQASSFCNGDNAHGWKASFDWITSNATNYVKVLEGNYDRNTRKPESGPGPAGAGRITAERGDYEDRL